MLRQYQIRALDDLREGYRARVRSQILVAPTGSGKTTIAAELIRLAVARGRRIWFVAHRRELISQCSARLTLHGVPHGILQAERTRDTECPVLVVSVQTAIRRSGLAPPDLVIIDEAHRSTARTYACVTDAYPKAWVLGLTATPWRLDGEPLGGLYRRLVLATKPQELIDSGYLLAPRVYSWPIDLTAIPTRGGDYAAEAVEHRVGRLVGRVVDTWTARVAPLSSRRTVVFAATVRHSENIVAAFTAAGIRAAHVDAETPTAERDATLAAIRAGEIDVVSNVGILTEGWDLPELAVVTLARPTRSLGLYLQMVGRGMRPHPESGKSEFLILDHAGCLDMHGFPQSDREYSLTTRGESKAKEDSPAIRTCRECFFVFLATLPACPECGWIVPRKTPAEIIEEARELEEREYRAAALAEKLAELKRLYETSQRRGYKRGWVDHRYRDRFGEVPTESMRRAARG